MPKSNSNTGASQVGVTGNVQFANGEFDTLNTSSDAPLYDPVTADLATVPADFGLKAWTQPVPELQGGAALPTAGSIFMRRLYRVPPCTVTNIVTYLTSGGSTLTAGQCFVALFTAAGALIGQSADQATAWAGTGVQTMPLTGGPFNLASGDYYVGAWFNGSASPGIARGMNIASALAGMGQVSPALRVFIGNTGVTTTAPSSVTLSGTTSCDWWFGLN